MLELDYRDNLIIGLYDSVLDPARAQQALTAIDLWLGSDGMHLIGWSNTLGSTINLGTQRLAKSIHIYDRHARALDPRWDHVHHLAVGQPFFCQHEFDERFVAKNVFYQEILIPRAGMRYVMGGKLFQNTYEEVVLVANHEVGRKPFSQAQQQALSGLMPHFTSWLRQLKQSELLRSAAWAGEAGLEGMEQGVVLLNTERRILYLNRLAERFFPCHPGNERGQHALLESRQIDAAIRRVQLNRQPESLQATLRQQPAQTCVINILPVPQAGFSHGPLLPGFSSHDELAAHAGCSHPQGLHLHPCGDVILLIRPKHRQTAASTASLAELFALPPAESRLARALALGSSSELYAQEHGLSINTVRSQIRALLAKTGEDSLQGLLRLLSALSGF